MYPRDPGKAGLIHRVVLQARGLFALMRTRDLIRQDGSVLLPLPRAAGSLLHTAVPASSPAWLAYNCAESRNKIY